MAMNKVAVDEMAKKYWKLLYADLGYGEALVRDIPRRIKAALVDMKRVASVTESAVVIPIAVAKQGSNVVMEGMLKDAKTRLLFKASLDSDGNVSSVSSIAIRPTK